MKKRLRVKSIHPWLLRWLSCVMPNTLYSALRIVLSLRMSFSTMVRMSGTLPAIRSISM